MADKYTFKDVHRLYYWCNKVLPTVYDDSLSYYELLNKIALKLNTLIENYNELPEYIVQEIAEMLQSEELGAILQGVISNFMLNVKYPPAGITPAVGDGAADDTEAIQGCIDWAAENGGGAVYIPAGWYLTQSITLKENVSLIGYDRYATVFTLKGGATEPLVTAQGANTIAGITLNANTAVQTEYQNALTVVGEDHLIKDVILDGGNYGLESTSTGHLQINNVIVPGCVIAGLYLHGSAQVQAENVMVENVSEIAGDASYIINNNNGTYQIGTIARVDEGVVLNGNGNYVQLRVENATTKVTDNGTNNQYLIETEGDNVTSALVAGLSADLAAETAKRISEITRVEGLIDNEETARESADTALQTAINTETTNRTNEDSVLVHKIDTEITDRTNADTALQTNIDTVTENLSEFLADGFVGARAKNHFRYYVNGLTGSDDNDGLTAETAFRTLEHAVSRSDIYAEVRIYLMSAGTYTIPFNVLAGCSYHFDAQTANVVIDFLADEQATALYAGHFSFSGLSAAEKLGIDCHDETGTRRYIYSDGCLVNFTNCNLLCPYRNYGGSSNITGCSIVQLQANQAFMNIGGGTVVNNVQPNVYVLEFLRAIAQITGSFTSAELTAQATSGAYVRVNNSFVQIGTTLPPDNTNKYYKFIDAIGMSRVSITEARLNLGNNRCVVPSTFDADCMILQENGVAYKNSVRYNTNKLQYWNGTAWVDVPSA